MKILLVNKFHYRKGGSETYYFALAEALQARGHEVVFFAMDSEENLPCDQAKYFVSNKDYADGGVLAKAREAATITYSKEAQEKFEALLQAERPDVIHLNLVHRQLTFSILDSPSAAGIPVVYTVHDQILVCPNYRLVDGTGALCEDCLDVSRNFQPCIDKRCVKGSRAKSMLAVHEARWLKRHRMYDRIDAFFSPSEFSKNKMVQAGFDANCVHVMRNFVADAVDAKSAMVARAGDAATSASAEVARANDATTSASAEVARANDAVEEKYFLYFGRLSEEKGLDILLNAFEEFCQKYYHIAEDVSAAGEVSRQGSPEVDAAGETLRQGSPEVDAAGETSRQGSPDGAFRDVQDNESCCPRNSAYVKSQVDSCVSWKLKIAGDGPLREVLETQSSGLKYAAARVEFLGHLTGESLSRVIDGAYMSVICSTVPENMPFAVIESFMHGRPVVGARIGGIPELVREICDAVNAGASKNDDGSGSVSGDGSGDCSEDDGCFNSCMGFLCEPGDVISTADALMRAATCNAATYEKLSEQGRAFAMKECNKETYMDELLALYAQLIEGKRNA